MNKPRRYWTTADGLDFWIRWDFEFYGFFPLFGLGVAWFQHVESMLDGVLWMWIMGAVMLGPWVIVRKARRDKGVKAETAAVIVLASLAPWPAFLASHRFDLTFGQQIIAEASLIAWGHLGMFCARYQSGPSPGRATRVYIGLGGLVAAAGVGLLLFDDRPVLAIILMLAIPVAMLAFRPKAVPAPTAASPSVD